MASVYQTRGGQFELQFTGLSGERETIWIGKSTRHFAEDFALRIEALVAALRDRKPIDPVTEVWICELAGKFKKRLAKHNLVEANPATTVEQLSDYCIAQSDVEPNSLRKYHDAKASLVAFFGARALHLISPGDADEFARWLRTSGNRSKAGGPLAQSTVAKRVEQCQSFFKAAVRKRWISESPFENVFAPNVNPKDREFYVTREVTQKLMAAADPQLRLIIALARYGGLRIPSEIRPLRLDWLNRAEEHLRVFAKKTKKYEHKRWKFPPLFPEIRELLVEAFEAAPPGSTLFFPDLDVSDTALRNRLHRLCLKCGILPWPKLWQNMRATRETELVDQGYPLHVACAWLGNSPKVAKDHYLQIAKEHHRRAIGAECRTMPQSPHEGSKSTA